MDLRRADLVSIEAWPGRLTEKRGGWWYRYGDGYTDRANSTAVVEVGDDVESSIRWADDLARRDGGRSQFQLNDRADLEPVRRRLDELGREEWSPTTIMFGRVDGIFDPDVTLASGVTDGWFDAWWHLSGGHPVGREVVSEFHQRLPARVVSARVEMEARVVAVGLGIDVGDALYVCSMFTDAEHRGHGYASRIVRTLAAHSRREIMLQVAETNTAARRVYDRLGLDVIGSYRYFR